MVNGLREANWKDRLLYRLGLRLAFLIEGESMWPTLNEGDAVLVQPTSTALEGDIVLANHPYKSSVKIVKRVAEILPDGALILKGDNPIESTDSRSFGSISKNDVVGRVVCRLRRAIE
jgi:nickel-type superoxide dismutase maturation protease